MSYPPALHQREAPHQLAAALMPHAPPLGCRYRTQLDPLRRRQLSPPRTEARQTELGTAPVWTLTGSRISWVHTSLQQALPQVVQGQWITQQQLGAL